LLVANFEAYLILNVPPPQLHIQKVHATWKTLLPY
jgi:hypothetical protein